MIRMKSCLLPNPMPPSLSRKKNCSINGSRTGRNMQSTGLLFHLVLPRYPRVAKAGTVPPLMRLFPTTMQNMTWNHLQKRISILWSEDFILISLACPPLPNRPMPSFLITVPMPTKIWSINYSSLLITEKNGEESGWILPAMLTAMDTKKTAPVLFGPIGIG